MDTPLEKIGFYYNADTDREWQRLLRMRLQFDIAMRMLAEHLPSGKLDIADIGGGVGRYSIDLTKKGHRVTLADISAEAIRFAERKASEGGVNFNRALKGDARALPELKTASFDAALLMGPIYHLLNHDDRLTALRETWRLLKPDRVVFVDFLSRYSILQWTLYRDPGYILREGEDIERILQDGVHISPESSKGFTDAWAARPDEIEPLMKEGGFEKCDLAAMDCLIHENYEKLYR